MKRLLSLSLSLALVFTLAACTISDGEQTAAPDGSGGSAPSSDAQAPASSSEPESIAFDQEFSSGNYTAGVDFPAGKYDIVAVSGGGNVSSSNAFSGGINAVMGTEEQNEVADMYEQEYKNIDLPEGVVLSISGVTVRLTCDDASGAPLTPRNQEITETVDLGNGNFGRGGFPRGCLQHCGRQWRRECQFQQSVRRRDQCDPWHRRSKRTYGYVRTGVQKH